MKLRQNDADEFDFHIQGTALIAFLMVVHPNTSDKNEQGY